MNNRAAMKLTTARYFTPAGRSIQAEGIEPDIILDRLKLSVVESSGIDPIKEANLSGHLDNPNGEDDEDAKQKAEEEKKKSISRDYQLNEALNLLKGLSIMQARNQI
jgi:carboxyl-terminal processing protease